MDKKKKTILLMLFIFGFLFYFKYCEAQSIVNVLDQRNDIIRDASMRILRNGEVVKIPLNQKRYLNGLHNIDTSHCPKKFQLAWLDYVHSCELSRKDQDEMIFDGVVSFIEHSPGPILSRVSSSVKMTNDKEVAWQNLERVALEFNVRFSTRQVVQN